MLVGKNLSQGQIAVLRYLLEEDGRFDETDLFRASEDGASIEVDGKIFTFTIFGGILENGKNLKERLEKI